MHRSLGPGLLESVYQRCLSRELDIREISFEIEKAIPLQYKGINLECGYRIDFLVEGEIILELKSVDEIIPVHMAQMLTYLRLLKRRLGLILNFNVPVL